MSKFVSKGLAIFDDGAIIPDSSATSLAAAGGASVTPEQLVNDVENILSSNEGSTPQNVKDRNATIWIAKFAQATSVMTFATKALAVAYDYTNRADGSLVYIETYRAYFRYDSVNTLTASANVILAVNIGFLVRLAPADKSWQSQVTWYIDPANSTNLASDENTGLTSLLPLLTFEEFARRLSVEASAQLPTSDTTVNILSNGSNLVGDFYSSAAVNLFIIGSYTADATDTVASVTTTVASTNTRGILTGTTINFATRTQKIIVGTCTGGIGTCWAVVQKDLGASACNTSKFFTQTGANNAFYSVTNANPTVNSSFSVVSPVTVTSLRLKFSGAVQVVLRTLDLQGLSWMVINHNYIFYLQACLINSLPLGLLGNPNCQIQFVSCSFPGAAQTMTAGTGYFNFVGGTSFRSLTLNNPNFCGFISFEIQTASFVAGNSTPNNSACILQFAGLSGSIGAGLAVWDSAGTAVTIKYASQAFISSSTGILAGSGNLVGINVAKGGKLFYPSGITNTLTGTTELQFNGAATANSFTVATGVIAAPAALTTWAQLAGGAFLGSVEDYKDGTQISMV